ncbi:MAG: DUF2716 domain-containing protein [Clostridiales bacterium]|nr:DUF2716 domain-containing protein [Clostridiales bacterium]
MQVILDDKLYKSIWDKIYNVYSFYPSTDNLSERWLRPIRQFRTYQMTMIWNEKQEKIINSILCRVVGEEMFALDWQHDCFTYDPNERIPVGYMYQNNERNCNVYFPEYYPDGDYHFFVSKDWRFGLYGHPWRKELIVVGKKLILEIENHCAELGLKRKE